MTNMMSENTFQHIPTYSTMKKSRPFTQSYHRHSRREIESTDADDVLLISDLGCNPENPFPAMAKPEKLYDVDVIFLMELSSPHLMLRYKATYFPLSTAFCPASGKQPQFFSISRIMVFRLTWPLPLLQCLKMFRLEVFHDA